MTQPGTSSFVLECPDCEVTQGADTFHESTQFADKHAEHTGHEMEWVRAEFDHVPELERKWQVACGTCDRRWHFASEEAARAFSEEHAEYTTHRIESPPEGRELDLPADPVDAADGAALLSLITKLDQQFERGAPEAAIFEYFGGDKTQVAKAQQTIEQLQREGKVYQAVAKFYRPT